MAADLTKMRDLIAYVATEQPRLGKVRLFKLLYLIDFSAHAELGHSVTGDIYENFEMGPVPVTLWKRFREITSECVDIEAVPTPLGFDEQQMTAKAGYRPHLNESEKAIADRILKAFGNMTGTALKDLTHKQLPYLASQRGEVIPYGLAGYLFYKRPTAADAEAIKGNESMMARLRESVARRNARQVA